MHVEFETEDEFADICENLDPMNSGYIQYDRLFDMFLENQEDEDLH